MRKYIALPLVLLFSIALASPCFAQDPKPTPPADTKAPFQPGRYYHLDFVVREIGEDGKVVNSRSYSIIVGSDDQHPWYVPPASIRTGSKVAVPHDATKTVWQYQDIGVNIDCRNVAMVQNALSMHLDVEVSSVAEGAQDGNGAPVIRENKWGSDVALPLGKATVLFSSDDVRTKGKLQLELTATPVK